MSEHLEMYCKLQERLIILIVDGKCDSPEADALRDEMDCPWEKMTLDEIMMSAKAGKEFEDEHERRRQLN